jgi:GAF domain-containing protein
VLNNAVEQIQTSYPAIYHAQIFMVDENHQKANLVASTGQVGRMLMERKHNLGVGSLSVIGQVTLQGKMMIARAGAQDGIHRRNEFLPDTEVEAAFPLRIGDTIIGALDMQSKLRDTFAEIELPMFQSLADHLAIAIDNARLFEQTERRLDENQHLVEQTRRAAEEVEHLNQQLTGRFWDEYLDAQKDSLGLNVDFKTNLSRADEEWTSALQEAVTFNHPIMQRENGSQIIAVPLRVRGQVIGAMEFELDEGGNLMPEDLNLIEEVGEQLGLAAETNRLFETSQRVAQREALVNEIATRLQASNNVEMTLNEAARSLRTTLKANRVSIRLGAPPAVQPQEEGE